MLEHKYATRFRRAALGLFLMGSPTFLNATTSLQTVEYVDLERFMGEWYVIACIPTPLEKNIFNATETYRLANDGTIATTFTFRKGGFNGPKKRVPSPRLCAQPYNQRCLGHAVYMADQIRLSHQSPRFRLQQHHHRAGKAGLCLADGETATT